MPNNEVGEFESRELAVTAAVIRGDNDVRVELVGNE